VDYLLGTILVFLASALVIWIVGRLNLGLTVDGFMPAIIAAIVIAIVSAIVTWLLNTLGLNPGTGVVGAIVSLLVAAVILLLADKFVPGMRVNGFVGAIVAAIAIGVVAWLLTWLLGVLGIGGTVVPPV
jgi:putative membrane protein